MHYRLRVLLQCFLQVAIKIIDKTQLNQSSLQKVLLHYHNHYMLSSLSYCVTDEFAMDIEFILLVDIDVHGCEYQLGHFANFLTRERESCTF